MVNHECSQQSSDCNSARSNIPYEDDEDSVCTVLSLQGGKRVTSPKIKITTQNHNAKSQRKATVGNHVHRNDHLPLSISIYLIEPLAFISSLILYRSASRI